MRIKTFTGRSIEELLPAGVSEQMDRATVLGVPENRQFAGGCNAAAGVSKLWIGCGAGAD